MSLQRVRGVGLKLCDVLGLEVYVGPPRTVRAVELDVSRLALEAVRAGFPDADPCLTPDDRAQLLAAVYGVIDERDPTASATRVRDLLAIARRFGVPDAVGE